MKVQLMITLLLVIFVYYSHGLSFKDEAVIKSSTLITSTEKLPSVDMESTNPTVYFKTGTTEYFMLKNRLFRVMDEKIDEITFEEVDEILRFCKFVGKPSRSDKVLVSMVTRNIVDKQCTLFEIDSMKIKKIIYKSDSTEDPIAYTVFDSTTAFGEPLVIYRTKAETKEGIMAFSADGKHKLKEFSEEFVYASFPLLKSQDCLILAEKSTEQSDKHTLVLFYFNTTEPALKELKEISVGGASPNDIEADISSNYIFFTGHQAFFKSVVISTDLTKWAVHNLPNMKLSSDSFGIYDKSLVFMLESTVDKLRKKVYKTNGKLTTELKTESAPNIHPTQLFVAADMIYIAMSDHRTILYYTNDVIVEKTLPTLVMIDDVFGSRLNIVGRIAKSLLVEYCSNNDDSLYAKCHLGYIIPRKSRYSPISFSAEQSAERVIGINDNTFAISTSEESQVYKIEFLTDEGQCFPKCSNSKGVCDASVGACSCNNGTNGNYDIDSRGLCTVCDPRYTGSNCDKSKDSITCFGVKSTSDDVCSGHGTCEDNNKCSCYKDEEHGHWEGSRCERCVKNFDSRLKCRQCIRGWQGPNCDQKRQEPSSYCFGVASTDSHVCGGHGVCQKDGTCLCNRNATTGFWDGEQCQRCMGNFDYLSGCKECFYGYEGALCEQKKAATEYKCQGISSNSTNVCNGRGLCISEDTCKCRYHYSGKTCERTMCFGIDSTSDDVCSGHGKCTDFNVCTCKSGFMSYDCKVWNEGKGLWVMTVTMYGLSGVFAVVLLVLVALFKFSQGKVEYHSLRSHHQLHDEDDDDEEDLFLNDEDDEEELVVKQQGVTAVSDKPAVTTTQVEDEQEEEEEEQHDTTQQDNNAKFTMGDSDEEDKI